MTADLAPHYPLTLDVSTAEGPAARRLAIPKKEELVTRRKKEHADARGYMDHIRSIIMAAFGGSAEIVGWAIGLGITAVLFVVCALPIYFVLKKISGSKTTFAEDLQEYLTARPQPRPETLRMLSTLDSVECTFLEIYKYVLIIGLALASVFIAWFFINVHNDPERSFPQLYFGAAYLVLVFWVVSNLAMIKRRQARNSLAGMTQTASPVPESAIRASVDPAPPADIKTAPSQDARPAPSALTLQEIVIVIMVFVFAVGTFSVVLLMLRNFPRLPF